MSPRDTIIDCRDLSKVYVNGDTRTLALDHVSFRVAAGEFVAIMGPSGSGKSTLMHILGALDTPTSGQYLLDGQDLSRLDDDALSEIRIRRIGFVFQAFNLLKRTSVLRNVMLPLVYAEVPPGERAARARRALQAVAFDADRYDHLSNQISGGQMQRVAIARALVTNPTLILADEPTGNLDSRTGDAVMRTFRALNRDHGHTIVVITHEAEIAAYADRVITVRDGRIVEDRPNTHHA